VPLSTNQTYLTLARGACLRNLCTHCFPAIYIAEYGAKGLCKLFLNLGFPVCYCNLNCEYFWNSVVVVFQMSSRPLLYSPMVTISTTVFKISRTILSAHTKNLCFVQILEKQRLFHCTALTLWSFKNRRRCLLRGTN
jgi:hypothetical protein